MKINNLFRKYLIILVVILFTSCSKEHNGVIYFKNFQKEYSLNSKPLIPLYSAGAGLLLFDSLLIIRDPYSNDYFFKIYNINRKNGNFVCSFLKKGKGPEEMVAVGPVTVDKKNKILWVADYLHNDLWGYNIDSLLHFKNYSGKRVIHLPEKVYPIREIHYYDSRFFLPDLAGGTRLLVFNTAGKEVKVIGKLSLKNEEIVAGSEFSVTRHNICPEKGKIITAFKYLDRIIIHNIQNDEEYIEIIGPDHLKIKKQKERDKLNRIEAYFPLYPKYYGEFIYAKYNGSPGLKIDQKTKSVIASYSKHIHVFKWNGTPVARLNLDHQIISFVIDPRGKRLIAFTPDADTSIIEYDISNILTELENK